ncbi:hypothetical protein SAMN04487983_1010159 [Streptomyces sp. yr375]|uniref:hypothetical protein n=1 Tax=Streptomyces sp. yr375 TaxID=1761906 RepID=UPI0008CD405C|nr:hypothetical protein [Streptomyces sp. yr375]SER03091.1 hypothetical protein SAMN04487983_1010159 [Streptomyces sp. yr375]
MRIRATVAAVTGALALSALAVPAAQAVGKDSHHTVDTLKAVHAAISGKTAFTGSAPADTGTPYPLDAKFTGVKINNGKPVVAGTGGKVTVPVSFKVTHGAGVDVTAQDTELDLFIYRGDFDESDNLLIGDDWPVCTNTTATVATCKSTIDIYPGDELANADAATWKAVGFIMDWNDVDRDADSIDWSKVGYTEADSLATVKLQRQTQLTVNAAPEPVKKGKTITVTGKLTRANWDTNKYTGYAGVYAQLQFRKKDSTTYSTVKSVKTTATGGLSTTVKAGVDGYYRYIFVGTTTSPAVNAAGDFVDVK